MASSIGRLSGILLAVIFIIGCTNTNENCLDAGKAPGTEGGPCYPNGTCNQGLTCLSNLCVKVPASDGFGNETSTPDLSNKDSLIKDGTSIDSSKTDLKSQDMKPDSAAVHKVSTFAGSGTLGFANGSTASAQFWNPTRVAVDKQGKVYVADTKNNRIRLISGGQVSTFAGSGTAGFKDGSSLVAQFNIPRGIAVDNAGKVYVADDLNHRIRVIDGGKVSTFAGSGINGYKDDSAALAKFNNPYDVAIDGTGNVYVADMGNNIIRLISGGKVSTFAGSGLQMYKDGPAKTAGFKKPTGVAVDGLGKVYVADEGNNYMRLIDKGTVSTLAAVYKFNHPHDVELDKSGNILVACETGHQIMKISGTTVSVFAGSLPGGYADGPPTTAKFNRPSGIAVDSTGKVYVADSNNHRIRLIAP